MVTQEGLYSPRRVPQGVLNITPPQDRWGHAGELSWCDLQGLGEQITAVGKGRVPTQMLYNSVMVLLRLLQKESFATAHKHNALTRPAAL